MSKNAITSSQWSKTEPTRPGLYVWRASVFPESLHVTRIHCHLTTILPEDSEWMGPFTDDDVAMGMTINRAVENQKAHIEYVKAAHEAQLASA